MRGDGLTDEQIYDGYEQSLRHALALLRAQVAGGDSLLMVRNCHPGSGGANVRGRHENESQHESVMRINGIIARVAAELCIPVLDVYALDAQRASTGRMVPRQISTRQPSPRYRRRSPCCSLWLNRHLAPTTPPP